MNYPLKVYTFILKPSIRYGCIILVKPSQQTMRYFLKANLNNKRISYPPDKLCETKAH